MIARDGRRPSKMIHEQRRCSSGDTSGRAPQDGVEDDQWAERFYYRRIGSPSACGQSGGLHSLRGEMSLKGGMSDVELWRR